MPTLSELLTRGSAVDAHRPWPRRRVDLADWLAAVERVVQGHGTMLSLWAEHGVLHLAIAPAETQQPAVISLACPDGRFPSVGAAHPPAIRQERAIQDLFGLIAVGTPDSRPWLDHGRWGVRHPLAANFASAGAAEKYEFLPVEGDSLHQIAVGPVHAGIIEPGHFRFTANGETVVRLEQRLGYVHRGIDRLMAHANLEHGARLAGRCSGDSTVAYTLAFSRAAESATETQPPPRAHWLRALMAELERLANHLGDIGAICNDAAFALMHAHCAILRERILRAADAAFAHRLMRDCIVPGGVAADISETGIAALGSLIGELKRRFPELIELYDNTASLLDRTVSTGIVAPTLALRFGAGGFVGRASGRAVDVRRWPGYAPYDTLRFDVPVLQEGDVNARVWIRIREVEQSIGLVEQILTDLPGGTIRAEIAPRGGEGMALVEGFRGDILAWLRLDENRRIERCHLRDPSWFQWPLLEAAIEGNIVADFPLCNKSFNCSYAGHDL